MTQRARHRSFWHHGRDIDPVKEVSVIADKIDHFAQRGRQIDQQIERVLAKIKTHREAAQAAGH